MANIQRGEVGFEAAGKPYTLVYSINALCELESALGEGVMSLDRVMADPGKLRVSTIRTIFWAGLRQHHPGISQSDAGDVMTAIGLPRSVALFTQAFAAAFPDATGPLADPPAGNRPDGIGLHS